MLGVALFEYAAKNRDMNPLFEATRVPPSVPLASETGGNTELGSASSQPSNPSHPSKPRLWVASASSTLPRLFISLQTQAQLVVDVVSARNLHPKPIDCWLGPNGLFLS